MTAKAPVTQSENNVTSTHLKWDKDKTMNNEKNNNNNIYLLQYC